MKIALVTDGIPPYVIGGMQKHSRLLAEQLSQRGFEILLFHCVTDREIPSEDEVMETFPEGSRSNIRVKTVHYEDKGSIPGHYLRAQKRLANQYFELIKEEGSLDFIYTKGFVGSTIMRRRNELKSSCQIGVKFHGMNMFQVQPDFKSELTKFMLRSAVRSIMNRSDVVFSYGGKITEIIKGQLGPEHEIIEIPAGIPKDWVRDQNEIGESQSNAIRFLFVGRYDRVKGLPELYRAIKLMPQNGWKMTIVGPIPEKHRIDHPLVEYTGGVYDAIELRGIYDRHEVLLCPSISEGMPNVILEAMSRGLAIGATDVGANRMLIDGNGILISSPKSSLIFQMISSFLNLNGDELLDWRRRSIQMIESRFVWDIIVEETMRKLVGLSKP